MSGKVADWNDPTVIVEILSFRLGPGADEAAFLAADQAVQTEFASRQPGLQRRTTARAADGTWVVIDLWQSEADADACDAIWADDPVTAAFMSFVDKSTVRSERYFPPPG
jgi:hypothetical protein